MAKAKPSRAEPKSGQVNIRLPEAMITAVNDAVEKYPVEYRCVSDFYRVAIRNELKRQGMLKEEGR